MLAAKRPRPGEIKFSRLSASCILCAAMIRAGRFRSAHNFSRQYNSWLSWSFRATLMDAFTLQDAESSRNRPFANGCCFYKDVAVGREVKSIGQNSETTSLRLNQGALVRFGKALLRLVHASQSIPSSYICELDIHRCSDKTLQRVPACEAPTSWALRMPCS